MFVVGITGGIGSGKTTATDYFKQLGIDIIDADIASRTVVEPNTKALKAIAEHFGSDILLPDGNLNRAALRQRIFSDKEEKYWLESLLHPLIAEEITRSLGNATSPYAIFVSPLLLEGKQGSLCDRILVIDVPESLQITRTVARDNNDREQVQRIIASQITRQQRLEKACDVVENTGSLSALHEKLDDLHQRYLKLAKEKETR